MTNKLEDTWDKDETISAETASIYGLSADYTPDKAFRAISTNFNRVINVTVTLDGSPIEGVTVLGITPLSGEGNCVTDSSGKTSGTTGVDTVTISTNTGAIDVNEASQEVQTGGALSTDVTLAMTTKTTFKQQYTSSIKLKVLKRASVNYFLVGGGGSGGLAGYTGYATASGGAGGYTKSGSIDVQNNQIVITIGSGGRSKSNTDSNGENGGNSKISSGGTKITANGGSGGYYDENASRTVYVNGASGGSGSGSAYSSTNDVPFAGAPGTNGSNGGGNGIVNGGTGQGTSTIFDGVTYSSAGGSLAFRKGAPPQTTGEARYSTDSSVARGGNGIQNGDGGSAAGGAGSRSSGAGAYGCVWIYW